MVNKTEKRPKAKPSWSDVKSKLAQFDRAGLLQLASDLYAFNKDNQAFLHARFGLGANPLDDYKKRIAAALAPDVHRKRVAEVSVTAAKKALSEYTKAVGDPLGVLELRVFWCETAAAFCADFGYENEAYFDALVRQYRDARQALFTLDEAPLTDIVERLETVRDDAENGLGYGVGDDMNELLGEAVKKFRAGAMRERPLRKAPT